MENKVREMYEGDCIMKGAKYLLFIYDDGTLKLNWYYNDNVVEEKDPVLRPVGKGFRLDYGTSCVKTSVPFAKPIDGTLDKRWTKIK